MLCRDLRICLGLLLIVFQKENFILNTFEQPSSADQTADQLCVWIRGQSGCDVRALQNLLRSRLGCFLSTKCDTRDPCCCPISYTDSFVLPWPHFFSNFNQVSSYLYYRHRWPENSHVNRWIDYMCIAVAKIWCLVAHSRTRYYRNKASRKPFQINIPGQWSRAVLPIFTVTYKKIQNKKYKMKNRTTPHSFCEQSLMTVT